MKMKKKEWTKFQQVESNHWIEIRWQMKKQSCALKTLESFIIVLVSILQFYSLYFQTNI